MTLKPTNILTFKQKLAADIHLTFQSLVENEKRPAYNKNYISIGVVVLITHFAARKSGFWVRQESNPQSPTVYS